MKKPRLSPDGRASSLIWGNSEAANKVYNAMASDPFASHVRISLVDAIARAIHDHHRAANRLRQRRAKQRKELAQAYAPEFGPCYFCEKPVDDDGHFDKFGNCKKRTVKA